MPSLWHRGNWPVLCDQACHLARGSEGGEDYAMPVGTPLYAPTSGEIRWRVAGTGGWTLTLEGDDGREYEAMHTSASVIGPLGGGWVRVAAGQLVGYSGGAVGHPGAGSSTGPHCHEHYWTAATGRRPISELGARPAGSAGTPFPDDPRKKVTMPILFKTTFTTTDPPTDAMKALAAAQGWPIKIGSETHALVGESPMPMLMDVYANKLVDKYGSSLELSPGQFSMWVAVNGWEKAATVAIGDVVVDNTALIEAIKANTKAMQDGNAAVVARLDALPAQIDQYADGKKQS